MKAISSLFLRAKHWQIFLVFFVLAFVGDVITIDSVSTPGPEEATRKAALIMSIFTIPLLFLFLGWFWSLGSFLNSIVKPKLKLNTNFFVFSLVYTVFYFVAFFMLIQSAIKSPFVALILPFHLFAMFCMIYNLYFVSKSLVLAETGKPASFYDYAGPFFLIWFFPIGVWFTQPRINRLYAESVNVLRAAGVTEE